MAHLSFWAEVRDLNPKIRYQRIHVFPVVPAHHSANCPQGRFEFPYKDWERQRKLEVFHAYI